MINTNNKRALYESIMRRVGKVVEEALENENSDVKPLKHFGKEYNLCRMDIREQFGPLFQAEDYIDDVSWDVHKTNLREKDVAEMDDKLKKAEEILKNIDLKPIIEAYWELYNMVREEWNENKSKNYNR